MWSHSSSSLLSGRLGLGVLVPVKVVSMRQVVFEIKLNFELKFLSALGVMVIVVGNGDGNSSSNPGRD